jgi:hypothetical protein
VVLVADAAEVGVVVRVEVGVAVALVLVAVVAVGAVGAALQTHAIWVVGQ